MQPDFWLKERDALLELLLPELEALAIAGVEIGLDDLREAGVTIDGAEALAEASEWARRHTDDLLTLLGTTNQRVVGQVVANWTATPGTPISTLAASLTPVLSGNEARARLVAVTETTRAIAHGTDIAYQKAGVAGAAYLPPAHPKCRCWQTVKRLPGGEFVQVWQSAKDEITCKSPIKVPWRDDALMGCRALQGVIISRGKYLGTKAWKAGKDDA
jgi:hypothetical protein